MIEVDLIPVYGFKHSSKSRKRARNDLKTLQEYDDIHIRILSTKVLAAHTRHAVMRKLARCLLIILAIVIGIIVGVFLLRP